MTNLGMTQKVRLAMGDQNATAFEGRAGKTGSVYPSRELFGKLVQENCVAHCWKNGAKPTAYEHTPLCKQANDALRRYYDALQPAALKGVT